MAAGRDRRGARAPGSADDGPELFRRALAEVRPLKVRKRTAHSRPAIVESQLIAKNSQHPRKPGMATGITKVVPSALAPGAAPAAPGQDRRTAERLRRGRLPAEARLDLHGEFQEQAYRLLVGFVTRAAADDRRVVLVITGKGRSTTDEWGRGGGVLRRQVPHWLTQPPLAALVLSTAPARPDHGGDGALYVLLRRRPACRSSAWPAISR
ncbi:MAG: hypothetical protein EXQ97_02945 [Alphaproteobacteria bacterium]|nr:hypothetical protein [Alphaproteobacteria bacterium]